MKNVTLCAILALLIVSCQKPAPLPKWNDPLAAGFSPTRKPFYHGVASGDPLTDRVIIWTRVTPDDSVARIAVTWEVAKDDQFGSVVKSDTLSTTPARDYTVKVDVTGLEPGQFYYYRFKALNAASPVGRTKTLPTAADSVKLAVVSCSNWEFGYFNAYDRIAEKEVDAVLHLGDYIYEYGIGRYGDTTIGRLHVPAHEIVSLSDYRSRHSQYRLDEGSIQMGARHPMIAIWDDHEVANNSYVTGAQNHQPDKEGDYEKRKAAARQAYYEWLPIREGGKHYRSFSFGSLADLWMLDERLEGRTVQPESMTDPAYLSDEASMLGSEQLAWLENGLQNSKAAWKVIGNQVIFSDVELSAVYPRMPRNLDSWDGYPKEKQKLKSFIVDNKMKDIIFLAGDTHSSWAIEVATDVKKTYNPKTSAGAFAVEFGTTSVSSGNSDEGTSADTVRMMETAMLKSNPHIKYLNARDHGYLLLILRPEQAKAEWYFVNTLRTRDSGEQLARSFSVARGQVVLK
ncbi:MAG TPA: alkaline phosphatase [Cytophagales bacterium]|nr:alkaline phosphatase [Cytophagales bacterium]